MNLVFSEKDLQDLEAFLEKLSAEDKTRRRNEMILDGK